MRIHLKYIKRDQNIVIYVSHLQDRKQIKLASCAPQYWNSDMNMITQQHPDFENLYPLLMEKIALIKKVERLNIKSVDRAVFLLNHVDDDPELIDWIKQYITAKTTQAYKYELSGDLLERNRIAGHVKHYNTVLVKLQQYYKKVYYSTIDARWVRDLQYKLQDDAAVSDATAVKYLSRIKSLYKKMTIDNDLVDTGVFRHMVIKSSHRAFEGRRKKLSDDALINLSNLQLDGNMQRARDTFMVLFELGGCDLTDLYFLKWSAVNDGRIFFERSKIRGSSMDLLITERVQQYLDQYSAPGEYVFPWRKDTTGYTTWRDNARRDLRLAAVKGGVLDVSGGAITMKCARHTFASRGKALGIDADLLRELMGHRRNEVDNFYKDAYSVDMRDKAQLMIKGFCVVRFRESV